MSNNLAKRKFLEMKGFDLSQVFAFMIREGYAETMESASCQMDGALQWLAAHAVKCHDPVPYVMLSGNVDNAWHAFLLNTRVYLEFCEKHVGFFIHHMPMDVESANVYVVQGGIEYTVNHLREVFGDDLAPGLKRWVTNLDNGDIWITAVSCVGNGYPDITDNSILGIKDYHTYWDNMAAAIV